MLKLLNQAATRYCDGMTTQREFLGQLIEVIDNKWHNLPEETENEDEIDRLARYLYAMEVEQ